MAKGTNPREIKFIEHLALGYEPVEAAIKAGYTKGYATCHAKRKLFSPNFIAKVQAYADKIPGTRSTLAKLRLPKLFDIEEQFFEQCKTDPKLYAKYSKVSEREYKLSGLLKDEVQAQILIPVNVAVQVQNTINDQQATNVNASNVKRLGSMGGCSTKGVLLFRFLSAQRFFSKFSAINIVSYYQTKLSVFLLVVFLFC